MLSTPKRHMSEAWRWSTGNTHSGASVRGNAAGLSASGCVRSPRAQHGGGAARDLAEGPPVRAVALDAGGGTSFTDSTARNYVPEYGKRTQEIRESLNLRLVQGGLNTRGFRESLNKLGISYEYEELPKEAADFPDGSCCLNRKDPSRKFLHNPICMTEGEWGMRTWAFIEKHTKR